MAATRLIPLHVNKGKTISKSLSDRTDYAENGEKTEEGKYISSYECDPRTVDEEFMLTKQKYNQTVGRERDKNVIAYQIRQSFKPGEVSPEEANKIGYELALAFTKGKHAFIVATHTDRAHIHNHIIFNSTDLDAQHKFRNFFLSSYAIRRISDRLCMEHGLSVINPLPFAQRKKRTDFPRRTTIRSKICNDIEQSMIQKPKSMDELLHLLEDSGYKIKHGKHISIKGPEQKMFIRLDSLDKGYRQKDLEERISGKTDYFSNERLSFLVDIDQKIREGKGKGYVRWAKRFNLKQISAMMAFLQDDKIKNADDLKARSDAASAKFYSLSDKIKQSESRLTEISQLKKHIINYSKTREIYTQYRKAGYSKKFLEEHREAILLHKAAKQAFDELGCSKIPKVKELSEEYSKVLAEKRAAYAEYRESKEQMRQYQIAEQIYREIMQEDKENAERKQQMEKENQGCRE
ncbi:MAG: relaxase/mobilization nuclease domain-containing protein [Lachnospiraceae bacterium]|nr:relaxase/mobilization nuclease domain-containing protein [Lachnospiraceae bacterium]